MLSYFIKPFLYVLLLLSIFGLVWLRSSIISMEYRIGEMQKQKAEALKEKKTLAADLAALLSIQNMEGKNLVFPDRQRVFYVKRDKGGIPYIVSLRRK